MIRGYHKVTCPHCGHSFMAFDIEDNATVSSMPVTCPKCKSIFVPIWGLVGLLSRFVRVLSKGYGKQKSDVAFCPQKDIKPSSDERRGL